VNRANHVAGPGVGQVLFGRLGVRRHACRGARVCAQGAQQDEIVRAIQAVASGKAIFGPGIARWVLGLVSAPHAAGVPFADLTSREREVLNLVAADVRNAEIARRLSIAPKTVPNHIFAICAKLTGSRPGSGHHPG
jgi:DNA-binding NarL/FixJ family response regulator